MPCVSKCCCCCSLKYGNLAYGIICLLFRICTITTLYMLASDLSASIFYSEDTKDNRRAAVQLLAHLVTGSSMGWLIATSVALFIALKGIVQKRSILLYPYIVVLIIEYVATIIAAIVEIIIVSPWITIQLFIVGGFNLYVIICLISLYQHMKQNERNSPREFETLPYKTV